MVPTPALIERLVPLLQIGFAVAAIRYVLEFIAPEYAMFFGVYYMMPVVFCVIGFKGTWGAIRWPALAGTMLLTGLLVWGIWNSISYTTGQFQGWTHGRFEPDVRAAPIAETTGWKIIWGLAQGGLTGVAGSVWCIVWGTLVIWLPGRIRDKRQRG